MGAFELEGRADEAGNEQYAAREAERLAQAERAGSGYAADEQRYAAQIEYPGYPEPFVPGYALPPNISCTRLT